MNHTNHGNTLNQINWPQWIVHIMMAVGGSAIYGLSLSLLFSRWTTATGALWIILSAGIAWLFLWLGIYSFHKEKISPISFIHFSLVTMRYGIFVLLITSILNGSIFLFFSISNTRLIIMNLFMISLSNIVMAYIFVWYMKKYGVSLIQAILLWIICLVGSGGILFYLFEKILP